MWGHNQNHLVPFVLGENAKSSVCRSISICKTRDGALAFRLHGMTAVSPLSHSYKLRYRYM